jgi:hypothetical protein
VCRPVSDLHLRSDYQQHYRPNSLPTDITLSQFLSIQEKGVSAWCFEPDYETVNSLLVHARTEITFLPDPASSSCVQSNLPLPKLNEVYYWEIKMFDLPETTTVAVGLATKPYPPFRLPGMNKYSVAYMSNGDKCHNYPFTVSPFGPTLKEGDVLGVGYRPRTGTVFYTRNGRKMEDAFIGLTRWNLFPTIGADGPCSVHANLGQAGFVFIEANVKKWGLAPSVGTLAPPPAYGSERGSILLDVGGAIRPGGARGTLHNVPSPSSPPQSRRSRSHRSRRPRPPSSTSPLATSPLRTTSLGDSQPLSPPPPITPIDEEHEDVVLSGPSTARRYISPTDLPFHSPPNTNLPMTPPREDIDGENRGSHSSSSSQSSSPPEREPFAGARNPSTSRHLPHSSTHSAADLELTLQVHPPPESPRTPNPPTPNERDIHLQAFSSSGNNRRGGGDRDEDEHLSSDVLRVNGGMTRRDPPAYSPLDAYTYSDGVHIDLPAEFIAAALEGVELPASAVGQASAVRPSGRRAGRRTGR